MGSIALLYTTVPDLGTAEKLALALVEARLAACVNLIPGVRSMYRWNGAVERSDEVAMIVKTSAALASAAVSRLKELHPYEVPAISEISLGPASDPDFAAWILRETRN